MAAVDEHLVDSSAFESWEESCAQGLLFTEAVRGGSIVLFECAYAKFQGAPLADGSVA